MRDRRNRRTTAFTAVSLRPATNRMNILTVKQQIEKLEGGDVLSASGYQAGGMHAGLRYERKDLGILVSEVPASAAAVYTQSAVQAAPLYVTKESIGHEGKIQAVIVNSACANACTGEQGMLDAYEMRNKTAERLGIPEHLVAIASTGVIGEYMKMDKIRSGIASIQYSGDKENAEHFGNAILTTDTATKQCAYSATIGGKKVTVGGAAKGSGMIHPNMATMLGFLSSDVKMEPVHLKKALSQCVDNTFNQITVDGDTSTNDMVLLLANGESGSENITPDHPDWPVFISLVSAVCEDLAKKIARDGEGATKLIEVQVEEAVSKEDARVLAKTVVGSSLVKTAIFGTDANWGRIIAAMGRSGVSFNPDKVDIYLGDILLLKEGTPIQFSEEEAKAYLENSTVCIKTVLKAGSAHGTAWGCDLTYDYVKINASYRT